MSDKDLVTFIQSEQERFERSARATWLIGGLLVAVVGGYLFWVSNFVRNEMLNPQDLATIIISNIERDVPAYIGRTERSLMARAPETADNVAREIKDAIPRLRSEIEARIDGVYNQIPMLQNEVTQSIRAYVSLNEDEIKAFAAAHSEREFAEHFAGDLVKEVTKQLNDRLKVTTGGDGLHEYKVDSLNSLELLNEELGALLAHNRHRMTRSDQLKRRLAVSIYHLFTQAVTGTLPGGL